MKKKIYTYGLLLLSLLVFFACEQSSDESIFPAAINNLEQAKGENDQIYDKYNIVGNIKDGWYDEEKDDCSALKGTGCISLIIIIQPGDGTSVTDLEFISNLKTRKAKDVFLSNKSIAYKFFDKIVVNGVIDGYFNIEWTYNKKNNIDYFKIKRVKDGIIVGIKPIQIQT